MTSEAERFVGEVFGRFPDACPHIVLWFLRTKRASFPKSRHGIVGLVNDKQSEVYVCVSYARKSLAASSRGGASNAGGIPGLWLDLDADGGHDGKRRGYAPTKQAAAELASTLAPPTILVDSGYGVQAWWLFDEPWVFGDAEDSALAADLEGRWVEAHRAAAGWKVDAVGDLARIMRLPGTLNGKDDANPVPVTILSSGGPRYDRRALERLVGHVQRGLSGSTETGSGSVVSLFGDSGEGLTLRGGAKAPERRLEALRANSDEFDKTWKRRRGDGSWSQSEYDLSIASQCYAAGWTDQEVANAIIHHRELGGEDVQKALREDYMLRTLSRAQQHRKREAQTEEAREALEDLAAASLNDSDDSPVVDAAARLALFNTLLLGKVEVSEIRKMGYGNSTRYLLVLVGGHTPVSLRVRDLLYSRSFREAMTAAVDEVLPQYPDKEWGQAVAALLKCVVRSGDGDENLRSGVAADLEAYVLDRGSPVVDAKSELRDQAVQSRRPFTEDGVVWIHLDDCLAWLKRHRSDYQTKTDLTNALRQMHARPDLEGRVVNAQLTAGKRSTARYWPALEMIVNALVLAGVATT